MDKYQGIGNNPATVRPYGGLFYRWPAFIKLLNSRNLMEQVRSRALGVNYNRLQGLPHFRGI
jgi:hypothetical protein